MAAAAVLGVVAWMLLGNGVGDGRGGDRVRIIVPAASLVPSDAAGTVDGDGDAGSDRSDERTISASPKITVYVTGEVVNPGVYQVGEGQRLSHVMELAGGPTGDADLERINLAAYVSDAAHYRVPATGETASSDADVGVGAGGSTGEAPSESAGADVCAVPVNINTATAECLETLPGIGSVRADAIVAHREKAGPFLTVDGITDVPGIGDGTYSRVAGMITVGGE